MDEIIEEVVPKKKEKEETIKKALFFQRFVAYVIDAFLVSLLVSLLATPFVDTKKEDKYAQQTMEVLEKYSKQEISTQEYIDYYAQTEYQIARLTGTRSLILLFIGVLYYIVFQTYNRGQTIGKKLMKIRVVSSDGEISYNQMIFRSLIANSILLNIIMFTFMLFNSAEVYFYSYMIFAVIQFVITIISAIMVMNNNNGLAVHDRLVHTRGVRED